MIHLIPIGHVPGFVFKELEPALSATFKVSVRQQPSMDIPEGCFDPKHRQYSSTKILKTLMKCKETLDQPGKVLGVVDVDLYAMGLHFVFGEADFEGGAALISLVRLRPEFYHHAHNEALYHNRILKEALHEVGHTYQLLHCIDELCVMHFSGTIRDTDRKSWKFCKNCKVLLDQRANLSG